MKAPASSVAPSTAAAANPIVSARAGGAPCKPHPGPERRRLRRLAHQVSHAASKCVQSGARHLKLASHVLDARRLSGSRSSGPSASTSSAVGVSAQALRLPLRKMVAASRSATRPTKLSSDSPRLPPAEYSSVVFEQEQQHLLREIDNLASLGRAPVDVGVSRNTSCRHACRRPRRHIRGIRLAALNLTCTPCRPRDVARFRTRTQISGAPNRNAMRSISPAMVS
jgi:hypothetical protein